MCATLHGPPPVQMEPPSSSSSLPRGLFHSLCPTLPMPFSDFQSSAEPLRTQECHFLPCPMRGCGRKVQRSYCESRLSEFREVWRRLLGARAHCRFVLPPLEDQGGDERLVLLVIAHGLSLFGLHVVRQLLDLALLLSLARDLVHLLVNLLVFSLPDLFADLSCSCAFRRREPV